MDWIHYGEFHDSTLAGADHVGDSITLAATGLDPVAPAPAATIRISGVSAVTENGAPIPLFGLKFEDGELLTVKYRETGHGLEALLVIQWHTYTSSRKSLIEVYEIICTGFEVSYSDLEPA